MRTRILPESNYRSIFINGKTIRMAIDNSKPITELRWPEFYDVAINTKCFGNCAAYCYTSAVANGKNFDNVVDKIKKFFSCKSLNDRCLQTAIGGAGESTLHPDFPEVLKTFRELDIVPNYTTNAMHLNDRVMEATVKYAGGVAITLHRHLEHHWRKGIKKLLENNVRTNFHIIISDKESIDFLDSVYKEYSGKVEYFVLLPYMNVGFAAKNPKQLDYTYLEEWMDRNYKTGDIAVGANFYDWLVKNQNRYSLSLYPPEIMSKYVILDDNISLYNNSFEMKPVPYTLEDGCELGHARTNFVIP